MKAAIVAKASRLPDGPGVYIFIGTGHRALYVGKAARLRTRVRSYLKAGGDGRLQLPFLEREAEDVEFIATQTEQEALLLENTIIKKRRPIYNVKLRDDKSFLMLRLDRQEVWPWFRLVRRRRDDGAAYFGPYASASAVRRTLRLLHKVVPLRDCSKGVFDNRTRPCLKHQIGRCPAPCVGLIDRSDYDRLLDEAVHILRGGAATVLGRLKREMRDAATEMAFERAQALKLQIAALESVAERQSVVGADSDDRDAVGLQRSGGDALAVILQIRGGRLESSKRFKVPSALPDDLLIADLLSRYYQGDRFVPSEIILPLEIPETEALVEWLATKRGKKVRLIVPQRGAKLRCLQMAQENARLVEAAAIDRDERRQRGLLALAEICDIEDLPRRIHCLDVSTMQGRNTVASRVCFVDGWPDNSCYRRFKISAPAAGDDFSAMAEAVRRSLTLCETRDDDAPPDLLIVDGGLGQLTSAMQAVSQLGLSDSLCLMGLAKSRLRGLGDDRRQSGERLFAVGSQRPILLAEGAPETLLVAAIRDEAHRFAITYHRRLRGKIESSLESIEGVGPTRSRQLIRHFGSLRLVRAADLESLRGVPGLPAAVADAVYESLRES